MTTPLFVIESVCSRLSCALPRVLMMRIVRSISLSARHREARLFEKKPLQSLHEGVALNDENQRPSIIAQSTDRQAKRSL